MNSASTVHYFQCMLYYISHLLIFLLLLVIQGCDGNAQTFRPTASVYSSTVIAEDTLIKNTARIIHVYVALCDNKNQGIVKVPAAIGNGQDPANNLYWGCAGGVKGYFKKNAAWKLISAEKNPKKNILERCVFKHLQQDAYLVADAYDGAAIKQCISDFFTAAAGGDNFSIQAGGKTLGVGGSAQLISYVGHDGLMDFSIDQYPAKRNDAKRETIILSCISKKYFQPGIRQSGAAPLLWSTGLMSPEAYTLEAAVAGWLKKETTQQIQLRAAQAYDRYQHCGVKAASRLLVSGW
jgi:hypothetical protein